MGAVVDENGMIKLCLVRQNQQNFKKNLHGCHFVGNCLSYGMPYIATSGFKSTPP
jgi:hypothetical protein